MQLINPKLYEINTRVWIQQFGKISSLLDVPAEYFKKLADKGIDIIWLMGIWNTSQHVIDKYCFSYDLVSSYSRSLKDWTKEDVIGSPYAIDNYEINPLLGSCKDLHDFKEKLNSLGIKLFLDFVPNHFSAESKIIKSNPEIFLQGDEELLSRDSYTFYKPEINASKVFAHGRDPLFPAWTDTVQVNYYNDNARDFMIGKLFEIAGLCDGVRCDMAMLPLNNVFYNTWIGVINKFSYKKPEKEFWEIAIKKIKSRYRDFIFLAEAYWDLEWDMQQLGFDFVYDKRLTERLSYNDIGGLKFHLAADKVFQMKSVRFLENHDEPRAVARFGKYKSLAAAVVINTIMGMKFFYDGQFEVKKVKIPVQLRREPEEKISKTVRNYYEKLLAITKDDIFIYGTWEMLFPVSAGEANKSFENFFAWQWTMETKRIIVVINYSENTSQCRIKFDIKTNKKEITLNDLITGETYVREVKEIINHGLFIELRSYQSHILSFTNYEL